MLREILKDLSSKHSYVELHRELVALMKEEYTALKAFFTEPTIPKKTRTRRKVEPTEADADAEEKAEEIPFPENPKVIANTKIRIIKRAADPPAEAAQPDQTVTMPTEAPTEVRMSSKDLKAWQKEQEAKTLEALTAKGILPESLLTVENIKKWIEDEHRTFAYVAREHLGMPEAKVADFAKEHGIKSTISKKRAILSAKNRKLN
jgi:hypothetical protein